MPNELIELRSVKRLPFPISYYGEESRQRLVADCKAKMVSIMMEKYPARAYVELAFETQKLDGEELARWVDCYRRADGMYIYRGEFVTRQFLEEEFSQIDAILKLTAYVRADDLERRANDEQAD